MKLGICINLEQMEHIDDLGFDYVEVNATTISELSPDAFANLSAAFKRYRTPVRTSNCFFPGRMRLVGPDKDPEAIAAYVEHTMRRMKALGVELMVLGSGGSRRFLEQDGYAGAIRDLADVLQIIAKQAKGNDIMVVVEPLNSLETNLLNTVAEAAALVAAVNHPHIGLLADYYHMKKNHEPLEELLRLAPLDHIHIATLERLIPVEEADFEALLNTLGKIAYQGRISIEASSPQFRDDAARSLERFREVHDKVCV